MMTRPFPFSGMTVFLKMFFLPKDSATSARQWRQCEIRLRRLKQDEAKRDAVMKNVNNPACARDHDHDQD